MKSAVMFAAVFVLAAVGCGGGGSGGVCGDGVVDPGEECDDGNDDDTDFCRDCQTFLPESLTIKWEFNKDAAPMFTGDSCVDMGVATVEVELSGPASATASDTCSFRQVVFSDLPAGTYTAKVTPMDINEQAVVDAPVEETVQFDGQTMEHEVVIPYEAWSGSHTGTFFFRILWGGQDCGDATPPVEWHVLRLERDGTPVSVSTDENDPLDGSMKGKCRSIEQSFPQSANEVPWGPATFTITGLDQQGDAQFEETFDTFVGAGINNPELEFDVNSLTPDAGMPDAGVPDAGVDGGM